LYSPTSLVVVAVPSFSSSPATRRRSSSHSAAEPVAAVANAGSLR
jgi:hypothetical protein